MYVSTYDIEYVLVAIGTSCGEWHLLYLIILVTLIPHRHYCL